VLRSRCWRKPQRQERDHGCDLRDACKNHAPA
jgi:hypothetical protein